MQVEGVFSYIYGVPSDVGFSFNCHHFSFEVTLELLNINNKNNNNKTILTSTSFSTSSTFSKVCP